MAKHQKHKVPEGVESGIIWVTQVGDPRIEGSGFNFSGALIDACFGCGKPVWVSRGSLESVLSLGLRTILVCTECEPCARSMAARMDVPLFERES